MKVGIDFIGVSAGAVIFNDQQKIFLSKRGPKARDDNGKWEFPGGQLIFLKLESNLPKEIF